MKILIAGDSWAFGEWIPNPSGVPLTEAILHTGINFYLEQEGHQIVNCAYPGGSNLHSFNRVKYFLEQDKFDKIFWIQTDPFRDLRSTVEDHGSYKKDLYTKTFKEFLEKHDRLLENVYNKFNTLNVQINCIGGCSRLNLDMLKNYQNLNPCIESVILLLYPNFDLPNIWISDWLEIDPPKTLIDFLWIEEEKRNVLNTKKCAEYFWPDGNHPNRKGHKIMFDYLKKVVDI